VKPAQAAHLSIVVLPFANLSGDPTQDYFADGITENLTTELSRIRDSFVIARNTAFTFKGKNADARQIGKDLGVRYVLEGSVQRDQNQVRVNAQLIDAESGGHLWAERFDKPLSNLFSMQDEIVASLASRLGAELITNEARRAERTPNPDSMDLYFQGMSWINMGRNPADTARVRGFFERALALDPDNLDAAIGLACADGQAAVGITRVDRLEVGKELGADGRAQTIRADQQIGFHLSPVSEEELPCRFESSMFAISNHSVAITVLLSSGRWLMSAGLSGARRSA
jgi:TolB-like protein